MRSIESDWAEKWVSPSTSDTLLLMCSLPIVSVTLVLAYAQYKTGASPVAQWVKNLPAMWEIQEAWIRSLGREDPLEKEMTTHFSILAWEMPWTEEPEWLWSIALQRIKCD